MKMLCKSSCEAVLQIHTENAATIASSGAQIGPHIFKKIRKIVPCHLAPSWFFLGSPRRVSWHVLGILGTLLEVLQDAFWSSFWEL